MSGEPACVSVECPAKTNLTLHVGESCKAWGGRHELDTIYCAISLADTVTATVKPQGTGFSLELNGDYLGDLSSSDMRRNHAVLALFAMAEQLWELGWPTERLKDVAATLGSDMPFCITGGYAHGTGCGERTEMIAPDGDEAADLRRQGYCGCLVVGAYRTQLSTPDVYAAFDRMGRGEGDDNHLQRAAIKLHPRSGEAIAAALDAGARHAFVSGSGPSVVAFTPTPSIRQAVIAAWRRGGSVDRIIAAEAPAVPVLTRHGCTISLGPAMRKAVA